MKKLFLFMALVCAACTELSLPGNRPGFIRISFDNSFSNATRGIPSIPETDDFILTVSDSEGGIIYKGRFADSPEKVEVPAGNYTVSAVSCDFNGPCYSAPQYGDTRVVSVTPGAEISVALDCSQQNSGIRLGVSAEFRTKFPNAIFYFDMGGDKLMYSYGEDRTAYFNPGKVSLTMVEPDKEQSLFSRILEPRQMLSITLTASPDISGNGSGGISVQLDTARNWSTEEFRYGEPGAEGYSVSEARSMGAVQDVWVYGYIVGSFSSSSRCEFSAPFSKNTNIVLAGRTSADDKGQCLSVELKSGEMRDVLNLVDNPGNLGRKIWLHGDLTEAYYGIPGLKNLSGFRWN